MFYAFKITYDKGHVELVHLEDERWEAIDDASLLEKVCLELSACWFFYLWQLANMNPLDYAG